jgi:hypothetical protein
MFVGGSALVTETYRVEEKAKAQGLHDLIVFCTTATSSFASGLLLKANGWAILNYVAAPFLIIVTIAMLWMILQRRTAQPPAL